ncbi:MAG: hypothetical protein ABI969_11020 [bacterium]
MDALSIILTAIGSSGAISYGVVRVLTKQLIEHRLAKDLAEHKGAIDARVGVQLAEHKATLDERMEASKTELAARLATAKSELDASLRKDVEDYLGEQAAERQYRLDARKRLYTAIGPLRFQLVVACGDLAGRVDRIVSGRQGYATALTGYFGRSTAFRLLRPFAVAELIERQMAYADFSADPSTLVLLRFKEAAFRCLTSSTIALDHPRANWSDQIEHVYRDRLSVIAASMIVIEGNGKSDRVMHFDEFDAFASTEEGSAMLDPIPSLMDGFTNEAKPILWIRCIVLAQLCSAFVAREGTQLGMAAEPYDGARRLSTSTDAFLSTNIVSYCRMLQDVVDSLAAPATRAPN